MKRWIWVFLVAISLCFSGLLSAQDAPVAVKYIILKADDLQNDPEADWDRFANLVLKEDIKANLGIIGSGCVDAPAAFWNRLKTLVTGGHIELWNHSYEHVDYTTLTQDAQRQLIVKNQELVRSKLGVTMAALGTPFNTKVYSTNQVLKTLPEIKIWMYGYPAFSGLNLKRYGDLEFPVTVANYAQFSENFPKALAMAADDGSDYLCLQCHPGKYDAQTFADLVKIIEFLKAKNLVFVTLSEYLATHPKPAEADESEED